MPLHGLENLRGRYFVEETTYEWKNKAPRPGHARVCLEITLEGLLADYRMGSQAPGEMMDLLSNSISARICDTQLPEHLSKWEIDEIMAPLFPSVADRSRLNPKFNYLVYDTGSIDWQLGTPAEFKALADRFFSCGIAIVPDMIFAHAVRKPFAGSMDTVDTGTDSGTMIDSEAFLFRDYGTWMYDWENSDLRQLFIEKLSNFVEDYHFPAVRIDYVDGMILQYQDRTNNAAETMIYELSTAMKKIEPQPIIIGEAFSTAGNPAVQSLIDVPYRPRGFLFAEQLYKPQPPGDTSATPDIGPIENAIRDLENVAEPEAVYAQLHDEAWDDEMIRMGRPNVPWAYGAQPAELAFKCAEQLVENGHIDTRDILDYVRRRVRGVEALTMLCSTVRYLMLPSVDSLGLGRLDDPGRWRMLWDDPLATDMQRWLDTNLKEWEIFRLHDQHRADMIRLRKLYRALTPIDEANHRPMIRINLFHIEEAAGLLSIERFHTDGATPPVLVLFNFSQQNYPAHLPYQLKLRKKMRGEWRVLFDGDRCNKNLLRQGERSPGYEQDQVIRTRWSNQHQSKNVLHLGIGANSMLILERIVQ
ncbi:MAG: hypothetical protein GY808_16990 [Gammaproteobacteria bacterium]|nr:hypothetical protein [Gammaproteobacteria bacterium]